MSLDGVDLRQLDPNFLRDEVALFNQAPRLFLGTLRENLDLSRTDGYSTDQELLTALQRFNLTQIVRRHPRGLDMPLGEDGHGLSGGQKQIVSLARLTLRHPRVVLLDEPTASLDEMTEQQALQGIAQWAKDKTLVVVTHRRQVLGLVNRVVVVDQGKVVMDGPRDAVLAKLAENEKNKAAKAAPQAVSVAARKAESALAAHETPATNTTAANATDTPTNTAMTKSPADAPTTQAASVSTVEPEITSNNSTTPSTTPATKESSE